MKVKKRVNSGTHSHDFWPTFSHDLELKTHNAQCRFLFLCNLKFSCASNTIVSNISYKIQECTTEEALSAHRMANNYRNGTTHRSSLNKAERPLSVNSNTKPKAKSFPPSGLRKSSPSLATAASKDVAGGWIVL